MKRKIKLVDSTCNGLKPGESLRRENLRRKIIGRMKLKMLIKKNKTNINDVFLIRHVIFLKFTISVF